MILIQFPLHHSNISAKGNLSFLCLQVKQDLRGRVVKHICPSFYQYLLNNFTNIQIRREKFISQILSLRKWSGLLLSEAIVRGENI